MNKAHLEPDAMNAHVTAHIDRNEAGRLRVTGVDVTLTPCFAGADNARFERCKTLYQEFCTVAESIRHGIPVNVTVVRCGEEVPKVA
jgi:organic hydroperoxide reductase OsmC/OhrA